MDMEGFLVFSGTEHLVVFVDDITEEQFLPLASLYRHHEMFQPYGVNVNFAQIKENDLIHVRTFEKGVEKETLSCGTGGAATAIAYKHLKNQCRVRIISSKNEETVFAFDSSKALWMLGPAKFVYKGNFTPKKSFIH